ncbi:MAG TPA: SPOR domain-containing protein [Candidatus Eisenbacteria bacterium]|nr:SPOR domain-containing protein [Candidatus Eisenbacteria bacterium]
MRPSFSRAAALALIALLGCAHAPERAPAPAPAPVPAGPGGSASQATPAPSAGAEPRAQAAPPRLDPSEEITPEELASIPDPVPGGSSPAPIEEAPLAPGAQALPQAPAPPAAAPTTPAPSPVPDAAGPTAAAGVWRVQIFASPDRAQAERVGREASERLGASYVLAQDGNLVKVQLGSFTREEDAQALKERAVKSGYAGAFRVLDKGGS